MNCKPGQMAVVIKGTDRHEKSWIGRVVRVIRVRGLGVDGSSLYWEYEGQRLVHPLYGECLAVADIALRPITPPPGSVSDEEVRELYQPKTTEPA
jgi:hypothetical protein